MKTLWAAVLLLTFILCFCVWNAKNTECACDRLINAVQITDSAESVKQLRNRWNTEKGMISLTVNRSLLAQAENSLAKLQESLADPVLLKNAKAELICVLKTVKNSYGISFSSIL